MGVIYCTCLCVCQDIVSICPSECIVRVGVFVCLFVSIFRRECFITPIQYHPLQMFTGLNGLYELVIGSIDVGLWGPAQTAVILYNINSNIMTGHSSLPLKVLRAACSPHLRGLSEQDKCHHDLCWSLLEQQCPDVYVESPQLLKDLPLTSSNVLNISGGVWICICRVNNYLSNYCFLCILNYNL